MNRGLSNLRPFRHQLICLPASSSFGAILLLHFETKPEASAQYEKAEMISYKEHERKKERKKKILKLCIEKASKNSKKKQK